MVARADYTQRTVDLLFRENDVRENEIELIRLYASKRQDAATWERFFSSVDMDRERFPFNYMLSRLGAHFAWSHVPESLIPRLQGVRKLFQVKNMSLMARALKLMGAIQDAGIPMLVMRGGALRMALLADTPQKMSDIDIVVPKERYHECLGVLRERGYETEGYWSHSVDISAGGKPCADIHWCMLKNNVHHDEPTGLIAKRGSRVEKNGVTFAIPSPEDTFLNIVTNAASNYLLLQNDKGSVSWLADCIDLSERYALSYSTVVSHAVEYGAIDHLVVGAALMERFLPDAFVDLHGLINQNIDAGTYRRISSGIQCFKVPNDDYAAFSAPRHLAHAFRLIYHENACSYHLGDPAHETLAAYVGLLRDRLMNYDQISHFWEIPGLVRRRAVVWRERKGEMDGTAKV